MASLGIFAEDNLHRFALTPMAECLQSEVPGSVRSLAIIRGEWQYESWGQLLHSVRTGQSAFEKLYGTPLFDFLAENPDKGRLFDEAMTGVHGRKTAAMLDAYDFSDIGCGNGEVISSVLNRYPAMRGVLFDQPSVISATIRPRISTTRARKAGASSRRYAVRSLTSAALAAVATFLPAAISAASRSSAPDLPQAAILFFAWRCCDLLSPPLSQSLPR